MKPLRPADVMPGRGKRLPETRAALSARDMLLHEAARLHFPGKDRPAATLLRGALLRYQKSRWLRSTCADSVCPHEANSLYAILWAILKLHDYTPSTRTIRRAVSAIRGPSPES
jgi:hypothetical protein